MRPIGKNAHGTSGTMNEFEVIGKNILQSEAIDGMGVSAADFHDAVMAVGIGQAANFFRVLLILQDRGIHRQIHLPPPYYRSAIRKVALVSFFQAVAADLLHGRLRFRPA